MSHFLPFSPDPALISLNQFAQNLCSRLQPGDHVYLEGPLGAGKTTFVRGCLTRFGVNPLSVISPTFSLVQEYRSVQQPKIRLLHLDLYRLSDERELIEGGFHEYYEDPDAITFTEWMSLWPEFRCQQLLASRCSYLIDINPMNSASLPLGSGGDQLRQVQLYELKGGVLTSAKVQEKLLCWSGWVREISAGRLNE